MTPFQIGISIGDPNGIGPEVVIKSLIREGILDLVTPIIYASKAVLNSYVGEAAATFKYSVIDEAENAEDGRINLVLTIPEDLELNPGTPTENGGRAAAMSLEAAVNDLKAGNIDALVTAPINKSVMPRDAFPYPGHTEMLTEKLDAEESLMFLVTDELRVGIVTNHIPVSEVAANVTKAAILKKLKIMDAALRSDFGLERPVIAVLSLNPHAGDDDRIGKEDSKIVRPAVEAAKKEGILAMGPFPADGFFGAGKQHDFDAVLAMYHDQGLIPFKTLSFGKGVNYTAGLPAIRTSPDHGTAYDLVGQDKASPASFIAALFRARDSFQLRAQYAEDTANPLESRMHLVYKKRTRGESERRSTKSGESRRGPSSGKGRS
ncbi:4-hydroxythreonine-4-phosphate dehydrogenase PdxA [Neolewinella antarctica]|uniref:4-hydroxythreonine-4-phosphate dehydrogenase n=1 Tax=Neolewinella antarctica TaxID=442734 RepID=A0ABX0XCX4_9BACT|nr:4-hydroxythreonine-4-phosphate dehydrogenase PdxA [Neolewinella antarctica]NJC27143.1 4-hydroxythreonine-4-phosphate dehydrogenase [Neolewinella antarctica]